MNFEMEPARVMERIMQLFMDKFRSNDIVAKHISNKLTKEELEYIAAVAINSYFDIEKAFAKEREESENEIK